MGDERDLAGILEGTKDDVMRDTTWKGVQFRREEDKKEGCL